MGMFSMKAAGFVCMGLSISAAMKTPKISLTRDEIHSSYGWSAGQIVQKLNAQFRDETVTVAIKTNGGSWETRLDQKLSLRKDNLGKYWLRVSDDKNLVDFDMDCMYKNQQDMIDYFIATKRLSWKFTSPKKTSQLVLFFGVDNGTPKEAAAKSYDMNHFMYELGEIGYKFANQKPVSRPSLSSPQVANMLKSFAKPKRRFA